MTVVCATDFSRPASEAVEVAARIAAKTDEPLLLWHSIPPEMGDPIQPFVETIRVNSAAHLEREADAIRKRGIDVGTDVVVGWPDSISARLPEDATLLVAGAQGHARGTHWLIGTVTERFARETAIPMLVVRDAAPLREWLEGKRALNVIVATDLSAVSDFALRRAKLLQAFGTCNLELLYVEYPPSEYARLGITGPIGVHRSHPLIDDVLSRELARRADTVTLGGKVSTRIAKTVGQTGALIALEAAEAHADLVVVGSHQRRALSRLWHGSIAHGVLHSAETNVLLIPFHTADEDLRALEKASLKTIVAATDFSPSGNRTVAWACTLARPGMQLVIVNAITNENEAAESARKLEQIKAAIPHLEGVRIETIASIGKDAATTICAAAERASADIVIVGRHSRSRVSHLFLGSVSGEVLTRSSRPVLIVPDPATI